MKKAHSSATGDTGKALLSALLLDSISAGFRAPIAGKRRSFERFRATFNQVFDGHSQLPEAAEIQSICSNLAETDLDRLGQRARVQGDLQRAPTRQTKDAWKALTAALPQFEILTNLQELLRRVPANDRAAWRLFFSTRPLSAIEIGLIDPEAQTALDSLSAWLRSLRGNHVLPPSSVGSGDGAPIRIEWSSSPDKPLIAITSFRTEYKSWEGRVMGRPDLSLERFNRLSKLVRTVCELERRPHYVVFPELSIPREWVMEVAASLQRSGISLIAGVEYEMSTKGRDLNCHNPVFMLLRSTDFGYPTYRLLRQDKTLPALEEEDELHRLSNLKLRPKNPFDYGWRQNRDAARPVFQHGELHFGVLICNELTDIALRSSYRGRVDALFVAEWNKDLKTFSPLIESTANDVPLFRNSGQ